jgi:hypothetical protein
MGEGGTRYTWVHFCTPGCIRNEIFGGWERVRADRSGGGRRRRLGKHRCDRSVGVQRGDGRWVDRRLDSRLNNRRQRGREDVRRVDAHWDQWRASAPDDGTEALHGGFLSGFQIFHNGCNSTQADGTKTVLPYETCVSSSCGEI